MNTNFENFFFAAYFVSFKHLEIEIDLPAKDTQKDTYEYFSLILHILDCQLNLVNGKVDLRIAMNSYANDAYFYSSGLLLLAISIIPRR